MKKQFLIIILILACTISGHSQDTVQLDKVTDKINTMFNSDSSTIFFNFNEIPKELVNRIIELKDSIIYSVFTYEGTSQKKQKSNQEMIAKLKQRHNNDTFIASESEEWRSTDVVTEGNEKLPTRKFLFGVSQGNDMMFIYWHGGIGKHLHLVLVENKNYTKLTGFTTLENSNIFDKLVREGKLNEIKFNRLTYLVKKDNVGILQGNVIKDVDPF